jgi:hypothetical protein
MFDGFVHIGGNPGESSDDKHAGWIENRSKPKGA